MTTDRSLVSAQPAARDELVERAIGARGHIGGIVVGVLTEPMITTVHGVRTQSVRLYLGGHPGIPDDVSLRDDEGEERVIGYADVPLGSVRILVRAADKPLTVTVRIPSLGEGSIRFELLPQRPWSVHLVHHSHFDFGYTDPQSEVLAAQRSYLDSAVDLIHETADWPEASRFRWNAEALWAFCDWERNRPRAEVDDFIAHVKAGSIELSALPYNLHTDVCSTDELHELLREARRMRNEYGIEFTTAMQTDVPGQVAGLPDALKEVGVKYLSVAHNWAGRSRPDRNGAINLPRMFRWKSLGGNSVLVWMTDTPHGQAYMEGPMVGFSESYEAVEEYFPSYLTALSTKGYPFPPRGDFAAQPPTAESRDPYPWDILHLRTQGFFGDNAPARLTLSRIVRQWNDTWVSPKLRVSRNEDFFVEAEERLGDELITVEGDWGDWWVEGVGSAAVPLSLSRQAQNDVTDARSISQLAGWLGAEPISSETSEARATYDSISMFNEHTWGASNSWTHSDAGPDSGELQWQWKVSHALVAHQRANDLVEHALTHVAWAAATNARALASYVVANPSAASRTAVAVLFVSEALVPLDLPFTVVDSRSGEPIPFITEEPFNHVHRESGRRVTVQVRDVPSFGFIRVDVVAGDGAQNPAIADLAATPHDSLLTFENEYLRVKVDEQSSTISSLIELSTERELINQDATVGFNGYIYDQYGSSGAGFNHLANSLSVSDRLELLASRAVAEPARLVERVTDSIEQRLVYEYAAPGADRVHVTVRLRHGEPRLLIENRITKPSTRTKESAYFAFPFAGADPNLRFEVSGGVTGDGLPHVPGAPQHMRAIRNWVSIGEGHGHGHGTVAWATRDVPLVEPHTISVPYAPFPSSVSPLEAGTVYSWVHNNLWDTNFPIQQGFTKTFAYSVGVRAHADQSAEAVAMSTALELVHPMRGVRARGQQATTSSSMFAIDDERVQLISVVAAEPGVSIFRLQSFADEALTTRLSFGAAVADAYRSTFLGDELADLHVDNGSVILELQPFEVTAVRVHRI